MTSSAPKKIVIITGEPSGDLLGARLMQALQRKTTQPLSFSGVGGDRMLNSGLEPWFPQKDLAVFGLFELLPKLALILRRLKQTVATIKTEKPDVVITIDSPDFVFRVGQRLKGSGIPVIHYVAPSVWAWRPKRAKKIASFLTHLLALFPFEPPYFTKENLPCTFVGHPLIENGINEADADAFREEYNLQPNDVLLTVLPGSRRSEVTKLLPIFRETISNLHQHIPNLKVFMPTVPHVGNIVRDAVGDWPVPVYTTENEAAKYAGFKASRAALCASGTVTLECALAKLPMVVAYKLSWLTVLLYYWLFTTRFYSLVNILLNREIVPERLQHKCKPEILMADLLPLLKDDQAAKEQQASLKKIPALLQNGDLSPADAAADVVLSYLHG